MQKEMTKKQKLLSNLAQFFQKFRLPLLILTAAIILGIIAVGVVGEIDKSKTKKSAEALYKLEKAFDKWKDKDAEEMKSKVSEIATMCDAVSNGFKNTFAQEKAKFYKAEAYFLTEDYETAVKYYQELYDVNKKGILGPVSLFNAAVAWEEAGNREKALEYYNKVADQFPQSSPLAPHALYNAGRINAELEKLEEARAAYNRIIDDYAGSSWTNLARTSIIRLEN